jgi:hypothetical protein
VWLGGYSNAQDVLYQRVTIPAGVTSATLSLWWYMSTTEAEHPYDNLHVQLRDAYGDLLETLLTINDGDRPWTWTPVDLDVTAYAGHAARIAFQVVTDDSHATDFFIDDVSLVVCGGQSSTPR